MQSPARLIRAALSFGVVASLLSPVGASADQKTSSSPGLIGVQKKLPPGYFIDMNAYAPEFADETVWRTIQFGDLDGDLADDLCVRRSNGVYCALSDGEGRFGPLTIVQLTRGPFAHSDRLLVRVRVRAPCPQCSGFGPNRSAPPGTILRTLHAIRPGGSRRNGSPASAAETANCGAAAKWPESCCFHGQTLDGETPEDPTLRPSADRALR